MLISVAWLSSCTQATLIPPTPTNSVILPTATNPTVLPTAGTENATSSSALSSGIEGQVTKGPVCPGPVQAGDASCQDKPYGAVIEILDDQNTLVTQTQADENGYFKIPLKPGAYVIHPEPGNPLPRAADQNVVVTENQYTQVLIQYDTGIR
jgi:hypothetical protein